MTPWVVCSPPGSSVHEIFQARIVEWVTISSSRGSTRSRDRTHVSYIAGGFFTTAPPQKPLNLLTLPLMLLFGILLELKPRVERDPSKLVPRLFADSGTNTGSLGLQCPQGKSPNPPPKMWCRFRVCPYKGANIVEDSDVGHQSRAASMSSSSWHGSFSSVSSSGLRSPRVTIHVGLGGSDGKVSAYNAGDLGSIPGSGRSPGEGHDNPLQYSCLEDPMGRGAWQAKHWARLKQLSTLIN